MLKMMQKLSNRLIDLEKEKEAHRSYKPNYKKREDNIQPKPPPHSPTSMNLTEVGMDNFCTFHQQPHSEKNFTQRFVAYLKNFSATDKPSDKVLSEQSEWTRLGWFPHPVLEVFYSTL